MSDSSEEEFADFGVNLKEFSKKRQVRLGKRVVQASQRKDDGSESGLPIELQYMTLLKNAIDVLKKDKDTEGASRIKMPLEVKREGRKTVINISEIAGKLHRQVEHLVKYLSSELLTSGSVNKDGKLLLKGVFIRSQIQEVLRRYVEHFVVCKVCDSADDTEIIREKKLFFLKCKNCGGSRCVGNTVEGLTTKGKAKPQLRGML